MKRHLLAFILLLSFTAVFSQVKIDSTEITSSIPALTEFHEIIFPMWHNAYPDKDINALKGFVPDIKKSMEAINGSTLPGILHEMDSAWKEQLVKLNKAAENYYKAAENTDEKAILDAAEELHRQYELSFRVIRPVMKEVDEYHQTLYIIFHKLYPEGNYAEIALLSDAFVQKAEAIKSAPQDRIKRRLGDKIADFDKAAEELYIGTLAFRDTMKGNDESKKSDAVNQVHSLYKQLIALFE
jgi:hypothetical protein